MLKRQREEDKRQRELNHVRRQQEILRELEKYGCARYSSTHTRAIVARARIWSWRMPRRLSMRAAGTRTTRTTGASSAVRPALMAQQRERR